MSTTFEKSDMSWYGFSILQSPTSIEIFFLFKDLNDGHRFFQLITKDGIIPSIYFIQQEDGTHILKVDYSSNDSQEDYIVVHSSWTTKTYEGLKLVKDSNNFKVIIGTEQNVNGIVQVMGTSLSFVPKKVTYLEKPPESQSDSRTLN